MSNFGQREGVCRHRAWLSRADFADQRAVSIDQDGPASMAAACRVGRSACEGVAVLHVQGELEAGSTRFLPVGWAGDGELNVLLELTGVTTVDNSGFDLLIGVVLGIHRAGGAVASAVRPGPVEERILDAALDRSAFDSPSVQACHEWLTGVLNERERR